MLCAGTVFVLAGCGGHTAQTAPDRSEVKSDGKPANETAGRLLPKLAELRPDGENPIELYVRYEEFLLEQEQEPPKKIFVRSYATEGKDESVGPTIKKRPVGPMIRAKPGETLLIDLVNQLPVDRSDPVGSGHSHHAPSQPGKADQALNTPHGFNVTNLHVHGLHVSPDYPSDYQSTCKSKGKDEQENCEVADNVLISVEPGKTQRYKIEIPTNHPPGTHWYHAHVHGSTAMQLASGMAGALIIEGGLDEVAEIRQAREEVMVFQQLALSPCGRGQVNSEKDRPEGCETETKRETSYYESCDAYFQRLVDEGALPSFPKGAACVENFTVSFGPVQWAGLLQPEYGDKTTINGELVPLIKVKQGELQRWRMIHAGIRETLTLGLAAKRDGHIQRNAAAAMQGGEHRVPMQVIAYDGIATGRMDEVDRVELQPGYRTDVLVSLEEPGEYELIDLATAANASLRGTAEEFEVLARVIVEESPDSKKMALPKARALAELAPYKTVEANEVTGCRYNTFNIAGQSFQVNGKSFKPEDISRMLPLGKAEEWVVNSTRADHPFHIHVNPFQLVEQYGPFPAGTWKDTLLVRANEPFRVRTRYEDFTGKFVLHCHILDHEDQGMMQMVEVVGQGGDACPVLCTDCENMCMSPPPADGKCLGESKGKK